MARMASLLDRLEKATAQGGKVPEGTTEQVTKVTRASFKQPRPPVAKAAASGPANFEKMFNEKCFGKVDALLAATKEVNNEGLTASVDFYLEIYKSQNAVFNTMALCVKPDNVQFMVNIAKDKKNQMIALEKKNRKFMNHIRCVEDSINLFAWFMIPTEDTEAFMAQLTDFYGAIDFMGTKLQGDDLEKKWYRSFREVQKDFYEFIKNNYPEVMNWTGKDTDAQAKYAGLLEGKISAPSTPASSGMIVEKKEEPVKKAVAPVEKKAPAPKKPVKVLKFRTWEISNYIDDEIKFDEDDVEPAMTFNFFNCEKLKVTIPGKFKNFMLQRCKRMELNVDSCVSMGEVIKCERIKLFVATTVPQVSVELCNQVEVMGTLESKKRISIMTTASQSISFKFPKDPGTFDPNNDEHDPNKTEVIPESFCSKFVDDKFVTVAEEGGFD